MTNVAAPALSSAKAWSRALALTAPIARQPERTLPTVIDELAERTPKATALVDRQQELTYVDLAERSWAYARWADAVGLTTGDVVAILMPNCSEYIAMWLGMTRVGVIAALINTNLTGASLAHALRAATVKHVIVHARFAERIEEVAPTLNTAPTIWTSGGSFASAWPRSAERPATRATIADTALYVYTSGTTGWPKAAVISHARIMQWTHWFAGLIDVRPDDRLFNCLPLYHSAGGVLGTGAVLVGGGSVAIAERFSARRFWNDVIESDATLFQYIGELCRYLLNTAPHPRERQHRVRLCCGNGLRGDVWRAFQDRFGIPRILEFYASTEGNVSFANVEGQPGAVGRVPPFLAHRFPAAIVKHDEETAMPARDAAGRCVRCAAGEVGEAIGRTAADTSNIGARFEGYTDATATADRIVHDVFEPGDAWVRTGDLMRRDADGYVFFVDRVGDTFRWKGENVSTFEVADALCQFAGVADAVVYGVQVPGTEGRAGMGAIVAAPTIDLDALRVHVRASLPDYARPLFLRFCRALESTGTFKHATRTLAAEGYDPRRIDDPIFYDDPERRAYVRIDDSIYENIQHQHVPGISHVQIQV